MKAIFAVLSMFILGMTLHAQDKAALNEVIAVFDEIDGHFNDWPHYSYGGENLEGGNSFLHQVWKSDGDQGYVKVEMLNADEHGQTKVQYYFKGDRLLFTLDRAETTLAMPKAPTDVVEKRYYFANHELIRLLEKKGRFPEGAATDTTALKNRELPVNADETARETYTTQHEMAAAVIERARKLEEEPAPGESTGTASAGVLTGEGWRMIAGSGSRDGDYALAWGLKGKSVTEGESDDDGRLSVDPDDPDLMNYVVNLRTQKIVGAIQGRHFGDKTHYNHMTTETEWSGDSAFVAQICNAKWATMSAFVYQVQDDTAVSAGVDLIAPTTAAALKKLKGSAQLKKFKADDFAITLSEVRIALRGSSQVLQVGVYGQVPKSGEDDSYFDCTVFFELSPGENGRPPALKWAGTELHAQ
ncbi:hypothetical protein [Prosthecobacter sp.]|uniref:hypothetical protein n=1 Tax=Prosthecobacter sp. TaxID=1965333 RepID=UPI0037835D1D